MDRILKYSKKDSDDYYAVLGCSELSSEEQIWTEYKARVLNCHPDKNPGDTTATERFTILTRAKEVLTNPESRARYDQWRRSGIAISYDDWCGLRGAAHTSMHWSTPAAKPSLTAPCEIAEPSLVVPCDGADDRTDSTRMKQTEVVSPRLEPYRPYPYQKAQVVDLTDDSGKPIVTSIRIEWEPAKGRPLLQKFRNYEI